MFFCVLAGKCMLIFCARGRITPVRELSQKSVGVANEFQDVLLGLFSNGVGRSVANNL